MVQVSRVSQWRFGEEDRSGSDASPSNRRNKDAADTQPDAPDLKWRPGLTRAEAKARAKEMRKSIAERSERREFERHVRQQQPPPLPPNKSRPRNDRWGGDAQVTRQGASDVFRGAEDRGPTSPNATTGHATHDATQLSIHPPLGRMHSAPLLGEGR